MDNIIKYFDNIDSSFRKMKFLTIAALICAGAVCIGSVGIAAWSSEHARQTVYVIDKGSAVMARRTPEDANRDMEAADHVTRFHELMFNLAPSSESIKRNVDRALTMSDRSAYDYWMDLSERGFYQRLVSANISQEIVVDSVKVDMQTYPYGAVTYGKLFLLRESNITSYDFESTCRLLEVERSPSNPHGMMIEKFLVTKSDNLGTRKRN
ncbi:MAG: conjugative transposon protein TraK [Bacteroidales bacterium]|jgi:conjugative transposon TraK protein|nr:conjugative transposon protein TraK [Bacteroidales bacterium]MBR5568184.1 conjugative transposon protein TraK [Bacteroidales bacterium]MBR5834551.1 conjugative transposon protein TraK [Bacteroidales bacterium]